MIKIFFRTTRDYKLQFISMIIMIAIGIGVYLGCNIEWYSVQKNVNEYIEDSGYADYRIYSENGFSKKEIEDIKKIDGIEFATRVLSVDVNVKNTDKSLSLFSVEDYVMSKMLVTDGIEYNEDIDGIWISDEFADANNIKIGDEIELTYSKYEMKCKVVGLAKSMEYLLCVSDMEQMMPNYEKYGFMYISPKKIKEVVGANLYYQINIISDSSKKEIEEEVSDVLGETLYVISRNEHKSYIAARNEIQDGKIVASIMPVLFLFVATLTMVTTMRRITHKERKQIGILKALGFTDTEVVKHYMLYGIFSGVIGSALGIFLGLGIGYVLVSEEGMMSNYLDMPCWDMHISVKCWIVVCAVVLLQVCVCVISVKKILNNSVAGIFRPVMNNRLKISKGEKSNMWRKLSFTTKWNIRDIRRNKLRSIMSLIGVMGCIMMLIVGFGLKSSMDEFIQFIDKKIYHFEIKVDVSDDATNNEIIEFADKHNSDWVASFNAKYSGNPLFVDVYDVENNMISFYDSDDTLIELQNDGVYICEKLSDNVKIGDVIEITPYGTDERFEVKVIGVLRSLITENITMTKEYADSIGMKYDISSVYTSAKENEISDNDVVSVIHTKEYYVKSYEAFMEILSMLVNILIVFAIILGIMVLYNLGMISYAERERELATLQVLGYDNRTISGILISQNVWITLMGIIVGLPLGVRILDVLIKLLSTEYNMKRFIRIEYYLYSIFITLIVSVLVSIIVAHKSKKIDMAESMKIDI